MCRLTAQLLSQWPVGVRGSFHLRCNTMKANPVEVQFSEIEFKFSQIYIMLSPSDVFFTVRFETVMFCYTPKFVYFR